MVQQRQRINGHGPRQGTVAVDIVFEGRCLGRGGVAGRVLLRCTYDWLWHLLFDVKVSTFLTHTFIVLRMF